MCHYGQRMVVRIDFLAEGSTASLAHIERRSKKTARKVDGAVNISLQSAWKGEASELLGWGWSGAYLFEMTSLMLVVDCDDRAWAVMSSYFRLDPMLKKHSFSSCYCGVMSALLPAFGFRESPCR